MQSFLLSLNRLMINFEPTGTAQQKPSTGNAIMSLLLIFGLPILLIVLMNFILVRPQKKEEKKRKEDINNMKVGDNIITVGGIVGKVINLKDDEVTISTSVANTVMTFKKNAVDKVVKPISDD